MYPIANLIRQYNIIHGSIEISIEFKLRNSYIAEKMKKLVKLALENKAQQHPKELEKLLIFLVKSNSGVTI